MFMVATAHAGGAVWFVRAGAGGDGRKEAGPIGSTAALERASRP
jgi:hypothetical protein